VVIFAAVATAALPPGEIASGNHWIGGWVGPRAGLVNENQSVL